MVESGGHRQNKNVSSIAHRFPYINFDDIKAENNKIVAKIYGQKN